METPRRRSQNREAKREEAQTTGIPSDIKAAENCVNAVQMLQNELNNAKKTLINADNCIVNLHVGVNHLHELSLHDNPIKLYCQKTFCQARQRLFTACTKKPRGRLATRRRWCPWADSNRRPID